MGEKLIEVEEVKSLLKKNWGIIVLVTTITTVLAIIAVKNLKPTYEATAKVFIGRGSEMLQVYSVEELDYYSRFVEIFGEISMIDGFYDNALKSNNIDKSSTSIAEKLTFEESINIPIYTIKYSADSKVDIAKVLDIVCEEIVLKVKEIMPETNPTILNNAEVKTIHPNKVTLPVIAFIVGIVLSIGIILVKDYLDDKVNSKKKLEELLNIPVLGDIPTEEKFNKRRDKHVYNESSAQIYSSGIL